MNETNIPTVVTDDVVVSLDYSLTVNNEIVDSSDENEPIEFIQGRHHIIPGLERELYGMKTGDSKEVTVAAKDGYGEKDPEAVIEVPRKEFPANFELKPGLELQLQNQDGEILNAVIVSISKNAVQLDMNHPLAGKELFFRVTVVSLRNATEEELSHGHVHSEDMEDEVYEVEDGEEEEEKLN